MSLSVKLRIRGKYNVIQCYTLNGGIMDIIIIYATNVYNRRKRSAWRCYCKYIVNKYVVMVNSDVK